MRDVREIENWTFFNFRKFGRGDENGADDLGGHFIVFHVPMHRFIVEYCPVGESLAARKDVQDRM
jgi:hypothetical protein